MFDDIVTQSHALYNLVTLLLLDHQNAKGLCICVTISLKCKVFISTYVIISSMMQRAICIIIKIVCEINNIANAHFACLTN